MSRAKNSLDPFPGIEIRSALEKVGVDISAISLWLASCNGCKNRKRNMNLLNSWARRTNDLKTETELQKALTDLESIIKG